MSTFLYSNPPKVIRKHKKHLANIVVFSLTLFIFDFYNTNEKTVYLIGAALYASAVILGYLPGRHAEPETAPAAHAEQKEEKAQSPLKIYPNDFTVPLNRMCVPGGDFLSDSWNAAGNYGSTGSPRIAFLFFVEDAIEGKRHYFICACANGDKIDECKYLGADIKLLGRENGNGRMGVKFTKACLEGEIVSSVFDYDVAGFEPDKNCDSVKNISLSHEVYAPQYLPDTNRDTSWIDKLTVREFYKKTARHRRG